MNRLTHGPGCVKAPTIWAIKLNRTLTFCRHLNSLRKKLTSRVGLSRKLAGSSWGADATTLRIATLTLVQSTVEYCAPVWCSSAHTHVIDMPIKDALRIGTEYLHSTPTDNLFILTDIQITELRRQKAAPFLARRAQEPEYFLYERLLSSLSK